jgi:Fe-S oxidoreductase
MNDLPHKDDPAKMSAPKTEPRKDEQPARKKKRDAAKAKTIPRQAMPAQAAADRVHNFNEVPLGYPPEAAILEAQRCIQCKKPKCIEGCPVAIDIPKFIDQIAEGKFADALRTIKPPAAAPRPEGPTERTTNRPNERPTDRTSERRHPPDDRTTKRADVRAPLDDLPGFLVPCWHEAR